MHTGSIADVSFEKAVVRTGLYRLQVREITSVGELVVVDDFAVLNILQYMSNEIRSNESGPTCHQYPHRATSLARISAARSPVGILFAPVSATRLFARSKDSNVPASVHQPSSISYVRVPSST